MQEKLGQALPHLYHNYPIQWPWLTTCPRSKVYYLTQKCSPIELGYRSRDCEVVVSWVYNIPIVSTEYLLYICTYIYDAFGLVDPFLCSMLGSATCVPGHGQTDSPETTPQPITIQLLCLIPPVRCGCFRVMCWFGSYIYLIVQHRVPNSAYIYMQSYGEWESLSWFGDYPNLQSNRQIYTVCVICAVSASRCRIHM